jgi:hypothetical protein
LRCRLAKGVLKGRHIGHGASRAIDETGAMTMPPLFVQGRSLYGAAETFAEEIEEAPQELRPRLTVCPRTGLHP